MQQSIVSIPKIALVSAVLGAPLLFDVAYRGLVRHPLHPIFHVAGGEAQRGPEAIRRHGCGACHTIPGVRLATGRVGPQLHGFREQIYIAGVLPNTSENLVRWIQHPRDVNPLTAMPDLGVTEEEARNIAAYLYANP